MLVLSRRDNETIVIGSGDEAVTIRVVSTKGTAVRLGIEASPDVRILRGELIERDRRGERPAA